MRHWRKNDEVLTFDSMDEEEASSRASRRYAAPRSFSGFGNDDEPEEDEEYEEDTESSHDALEPLVRAGKYKPKPSDPWTIHILYQALRDIE